jgi:hypothetical protein
MASAHAETLQQETRTSLELVAGGSMAETIGGAAACVLAIVGLSGILPGYLAAIATVAAGAALFFEGAAIVTRYTELLEETDADRLSATALGSGMSAESLGGLAAIALGVLALVGVTSMTLMSVAVIVLGGALLLGSAATSRLNALRIARAHRDETAWLVAREALAAATGAQVLIGIAAVVLGVLAVIGIAPLILILVGLLASGFSILVSGTAVGSKMLAGLH